MVRPFVNRLVDVLRRHAIPVWYSETNIQGAQQWHDEIGAALRRCDWFVLVLSPDAVASKWVKRELLYSLLQDRFEGRTLRCCIGPVLAIICPGPCPGRRCIDFSHSFDDRYRDLLRIWGIGYAPAPRPR